jgi:HEAT repeat protein
MKKLLVLGALLVAGSLCLQDISIGHGGTYRGPGDTVPPGGGGGGGGAGPSSPGPAGPSTGGPSGPSAPGPATGGPSSGGPSARPAGPSTGPAASTSNLELWEFWWGFNKDQYLNLKSAIYSGVVTGGDDYFLGNGAKSQAKNSLKPSEEAIRQKIVPALKEALEKERANDIVTGAMIALAKIGDAKNESGESEFEKIISKFLSDGSQEIHETAAVALGILANDVSVKTLESLLKDTPDGRKKVGTGKEVDYRTRAFAAYGLGLIGARTASNDIRKEIAGILIDTLGKADNSQRDVKVAALVALGLVKIDVDKSESPDAKSNATSSRQGEIKFIHKFFQDQNNPFLVRAHAPTAMARLLDGAPPDLRDSVAKTLVEGLGEHSKESNEVQESCVLALGQIGTCEKTKLDAEIRDTLKRVGEKSHDEQSKNFAMIALAQIGGRFGSGENIEDAIKDSRTYLLTNMTKGKSSIRSWAGLSVGVMERAILDNNNKAGQTPSVSSKESLRTALKDCADPEQLGAYAIGCGICKDIEAKDILVDKLKKVGTDQAKGYVAVGLGLMDARESVKAIQDIVRESKYKPELMKQAAIGLGLLGDKDLVPDLVKMLGEAKGLATQAAISSALGFIGDSRSIDPLVEMLKNAQLTQSARGFAAVALGIVADKEPFPWNSKISTNINYRANTTTLTDSSQGTGILDIL